MKFHKEKRLIRVALCGFVDHYLFEKSETIGSIEEFKVVRSFYYPFDLLSHTLVPDFARPLFWVTFAATMPNTLLAAVTLDGDTVKAGEELSLTVRLNKAPGSLTVLRLVITYADGQEQTVAASTVSNATTLSAQLPVDAPLGQATFALSTSGCGCGDRAIMQPSATTESTITGWFLVQ